MKFFLAICFVLCGVVAIQANEDTASSHEIPVEKILQLTRKLVNIGYKTVKPELTPIIHDVVDIVYDRVIVKVYKEVALAADELKKIL